MKENRSGDAITANFMVTLLITAQHQQLLNVQNVVKITVLINANPQIESASTVFELENLWMIILSTFTIVLYY